MAKKKRGPGRPRLSEAKKAKNKQIYKQIRKAYKKYGGGENDLTYKQFKNNVLDEKKGFGGKGKTVGGKPITPKKSISTRAAISKLVHSEAYIPVNDRLKNNAIKALRTKYPDVWERLKKFCRKKNGQAGSPERMMGWDGGSKMYVVHNDKGEKMGISFENSPEIVVVTYSAGSDDVATEQTAYTPSKKE